MIKPYYIDETKVKAMAPDGYKLLELGRLVVTMGVQDLNESGLIPSDSIERMALMQRLNR